MSSLAIIPARGGSKRIPRKNIRDFLGKPIITYSIEVALESNLFDEVMVSTDDEEIAEIAQKNGAKVPFFRSKKNSDDFASTSDVLLEIFGFYKKHRQKFDLCCCIYPTSPLLQSRYLEEGYQLLLEHNYTTVFPVVEFEYPILRSLKVDINGKAEMNWPEYLHSRSQDLPASYHDAGQFYWIKILPFLKHPILFGSNSGSIVLNRSDVQDIDSEEDWKLAEIKASLQ